MNYLKSHLIEHIEIARQIDLETIHGMVRVLTNLKKNNGRLFILGVGGSAANASHAVNDFRKICNIEAYCATDNVAEITARTNDEGWETVFRNWLIVNKLKSKDVLLFFSVGGGSIKNKISINLIEAAKYAKSKKVKIISVIGKKDGFLRKISNYCCVIPVVNLKNRTPHSETFQVFVWHMLVSHPRLKIEKTLWETIR